MSISTENLGNTFQNNHIDENRFEKNPIPRSSPHNDVNPINIDSCVLLNSKCPSELYHQGLGARIFGNLFCVGKLLWV